MTQLRIGDLARLGGVSVRVLRHYHEVGLLVPAHVDRTTSYRSYTLDQLEVLHRIVELKQVGLSLAQVADIVHGRAGGDAVRAMLLDRRAELEDEIVRARAGLARIDDQLAGPERRHPMPEQTTPDTIEVELKAIPARLVAQLTAISESWAPTDIGPVIQPLYAELVARLERAGIAITGPSTAWYEDADDGRVLVHATLTIGARPDPGADTAGLEIVELPAVPLAACTLHRGSMDSCDVTYGALLGWIDAHGHRPLGYSRELDLVCDSAEAWVTELQQAVEPR